MKIQLLLAIILIFVFAPTSYYSSPLPAFLTPSCNSGDGTHDIINGAYVSTANYIYVAAPTSGASLPTDLYLEVQFKYTGAYPIPAFGIQYTTSSNNYQSTSYLMLPTKVLDLFSISFQLLDQGFNQKQNCNGDIRLSIAPGLLPSGIVSIELSATPASYVTFLGPYTGPSLELVDASTLRGKVVVGYQAWFIGAENNYRHWMSTNRISGEFLRIFWVYL
jgi:hypothetical protein